MDNVEELKREIEALKERLHEAERRARADLEALIDTSPFGVVVFDATTGRPQSVNREAQRIVGGLHIPGNSIEQQLEVITCRFQDGREVSLDEYPLSRQLSTAQTVRAEEIVLSVPDGRNVAMLINATPIRSEEDEIVSVVVTMQDLEPLREVERMRAEFLGMVSHELRAPLTSIKGSAATVLGTAQHLDSAEMIQFFRIIDQQADHMRDLIGNLLDAGRIRAGMLSVAPQPSRMVSLIDQARNAFISGGGRQAIQIDLPPDLPQVMADPQRVVQVLRNLLSNAARHAPETSVIRVAAKRDGVYVRVSVADEGKGISPDQLERLFDQPATLSGREGNSAGHGLGLAICKGLVEAHGGRIGADSDGVGRGTRIAFTLPVAEGSGEAVAPRSSQSADAVTGTRVLVVDDDPRTLRQVGDALASGGYIPLVTGDPAEVQDLLRSERPDLVLLDLVLPGTDGIELMTNIPELANLPVVFISGYGRDETIARALESGAADYIVKPFSPTELRARVGAALRRRVEAEPFVLDELTIDYDRRRVTLAGQAVSLTATEYELLRVLSVNAGKVLDYRTLLRLVWGERDNPNSEVVRTFIKRLRQRLGEKASRPKWIFNERGVGYRMATPADLSTS
ncbi:MAG: response regulator [Gammaproteobacteria bacterium]|nr:response regulator [Gammaproteobacteria bacterium]MYE53525.1 response regulator [Gammaproteobacteria bacterium]MYF50391.1 response regulator [Gammaproteobacteria bacterium]MYH13561.1 response regulator [Gammaproteobacteria bacterium]MYK81609.1 response regulator [Gammaproteobacteria bacterium]